MEDCIMVRKYVEQEEKRGNLDMSNYVENKATRVIDMLTNAIDNIDTDIEEVTAVKLMLCRSWLENFIVNL